MRKAIMIPAGCHERLIPLDAPTAAPWQAAGIHHSGVSDLVRGYRVAIADQRSLMLIATTAGRGRLRTANQRLALTPDTLLINPPGGAVDFAIVGDAWSMVWFYLRPSPAWQSLIEGPTRVQPWGQARLCYHLADAFIARSRAGGTDGLGQQLGDLVLVHLREVARAVPLPDDPLARLWQEVEGRLHEPWPVEQLALRIRVSVPTLQRQLRKRFGRSAHQLLLDLRMRRAQELLRRTAYPLRVIAGQVGYSDPFTFSAAVRRHFGRSPSQLRAPVGGSSPVQARPHARAADRDGVDPG